MCEEACAIFLSVAAACRTNVRYHWEEIEFYDCVYVRMCVYKGRKKKQSRRISQFLSPESSNVEEIERVFFKVISTTELYDMENRRTCYTMCMGVFSSENKHKGNL